MRRGLGMIGTVVLGTALGGCGPVASPQPSSAATTADPTIPRPSSPYTFEDDFTGSSLSTVWESHFGVPQVVNSWAMSQATVANGVLSITASQQGGQWVSALIDTKATWTQQYGLFEARIKMPRGQGLWPAFWSYGSDPEAEIDMMEVCASPSGTNGGNDLGLLHQTIHWEGGQAAQKTTTARDLSTDFHVYGVDWRSDHMTFLLDGKPTWTFTDVAHIPHAALPLILDLAVGGDYCGAPDASTPSSASMLVDWVRVSP